MPIMIGRKGASHFAFKNYAQAEVKVSELYDGICLFGTFACPHRLWRASDCRCSPPTSLNKEPKINRERFAHRRCYLPARRCSLVGRQPHTRHGRPYNAVRFSAGHGTAILRRRHSLMPPIEIDDRQKYAFVISHAAAKCIAPPRPTSLKAAACLSRSLHRRMSSRFRSRCDDASSRFAASTACLTL